MSDHLPPEFLSFLSLKSLTEIQELSVQLLLLLDLLLVSYLHLLSADVQSSTSDLDASQT